MNKVTIYTDGGMKGSNPGPGGYAAVILWNGSVKQVTGGWKWTTNNRCEISGAIIGLETLNRPCEVVIHSDSQYLINMLTKYRLGIHPGRVNYDLLSKLDKLCKLHKVKWVWVKGHNGDEYNELADLLAGRAARQNNPPDEEYEKTLTKSVKSV